MADLFSLIFSGMLGGLVSICAGRWSEHFKREGLWKNLKLHDGVQHNSSLTLRVENGFYCPMTSCWAYLTIDHEASDVIDVVCQTAFINSTTGVSLKEDRLCWSVAGNPPVVDIYSGELQSLQVCEVFADYIGIFSEKRDAHYRVFLKGKKRYSGTLKIVSKDTRSKQWAIELVHGGERCSLRVGQVIPSPPLAIFFGPMVEKMYHDA